jgi:CheY-like chemotaxis protein
VQDAQIIALLDGACRAAEHGAELVAKLLAFSRNQHLTLEPIDLGALFTAMLPLLEKTTGPTVRLTCECAPDVWPALADPHQIELVLLNLAINARDAMPRGGKLAIRAVNVTSDELAWPAELTGSDCVMVTVADTGVGMNDETRSRAFEPFFTTKDVGKGSGLGLSMVQGVTKQCGGAVTIESAVARGTTVRVFLPRAVQLRAGVDPARNAANSHSAAAAAILLVEDDPDVRDIAALTLREAGHDVDEAASGPEALEKMQRGSVPHLLISDLAMPDMTGVELIVQAQALYPELRAIIITGFAEHEALYGIPGSVPIISKPFRPGELQRVANAILSERQTATGPQHP